MKTRLAPAVVEPLVGAFPLDEPRPAEDIATQRRGQTRFCDDVVEDPDKNPAVRQAIATRSFISVPLVRDGRFVASLYVNFSDPHRWTPGEIALVEDVAARTWAAVERARAEEALRASEERLRLATEHAEVGFWDVDVVKDDLFWPPRVKAMFGISPDVACHHAVISTTACTPTIAAATSEAFCRAADPQRPRALRRGIPHHRARRTASSAGSPPRAAASSTRLASAYGLSGTAIDISARKRVEARRVALVELGHASVNCPTLPEIAFQAGGDPR